jgi:CRISPR-associated protein Cmr5
MQTNSQILAQKAYEDVSGVLARNPGRDDPYNKKYATMAHRLPILIQTAGLTQALAFTHAKSQNVAAWDEYLDHVATAVERANGEALFLESQRASLPDYILLTKQVMAAIVWYKRFAESILKIDASQAEGEALPNES